MFINKKTGASYGFVAPEIEADKGKKIEVPFPTFGILTPTISSNKAEVTVERTTTLVDLGSTALAAATDVNVTNGANLPAGARLMVKFTCGESTDAVFNVKVNLAGETCAELKGVAKETVCYELVWTGSTWQLLR